MSHQHDPTITPEGNLLLFDNGTHHPIVGRSRVIEIDITRKEQINNSVVETLKRFDRVDILVNAAQ